MTRQTPSLMLLIAGLLFARNESLPLITPVEGPSNLSRLGLTVGTSSMGRTGVWGPSPENAPPQPPELRFYEPTPAPVRLTGEDLYRINCRPCHQADGGGVPPEINAITGPVQATSAAMMERRMKDMGRPITPVFAHELAAGSMKDLHDRLKNGGQKMPSFAYLTPNEASALISYLDVLAGVPGSGRQQTIAESPMRIGELLVKGTCHICHDATGHWPDPEQLLQGALPPISGFTTHKSMPELITKVRYGSPVVMGALKLEYRGRMPVFDYLKDHEVADAYLYLIHYAPK